MRPAFIYKILQIPEWQTLQTEGEFTGSPVDLKDGFIHMSTASQVQGTLDKHYTKGVDLILAQIEASLVSAEIKYEVSRGGAEFPHIYGKLSLGAVSQHWPLTPDNNGRYDAAQVLP